MKEIIKQGRLGYNNDNNRYGLLISDTWLDNGFHCGEPLEILVENEWIETSMEMNIDGEWYLTGTPFAGDDLEYLQARIRSECW